MTITQEFNEHLLPLWTDTRLMTPALVYDVATIIHKLELLDAVRRSTDCRVLYSIKAASFSALLQTVADYVDGFSVSSLFESRLAREILQDKGSIHLTSPGLGVRDMPEIAESCGYINFNSISQWQRCRPFAEGLNCGLRVNPGLSFVKDERYDPCRNGSKLGVPLAQLAGLRNDQLHGISGLHVHNNAEAENFQPLQQTVNVIINAHQNRFVELKWINLGGGYLIKNAAQLEVLGDVVRQIKERYSLDVFFEPGKGIVGEAGYLAAGVVDIFESAGKTIAVLDTTVHHLPEVFEYQSRPVILRESPQGKYRYRIAGASCLSGDLFGDYCFDRELQIGSRIIFANTGAYMLVKASMFNGINLPAIYALKSNGSLELLKQFDYRDYRDRL